jgi:hypothetical protein
MFESLEFRTDEGHIAPSVPVYRYIDLYPVGIRIIQQPLGNVMVILCLCLTN